MKSSFLLKTFLPVFAAIILVAGIAYAAWTEPTASPPGDNVAAPINTGSISQIKTGVLGVLGLVTNNFQMTTGAGAGKVLTSDATGTGTWQAGGGGGSGGWYVPSDIKLTSNNHDGNFGGFKGMYDWIQGNGCAGYHVCMMGEMISYAQINGNSSIPGGGYYAEFHKTYPSDPASHIVFCNGYTSTSGAAMVLRDSSLFPDFEVQYCWKSLPVMCCK